MSPHLGPYAFLPDFVEFMIHGDLAILAAAEKVSPEEYHKDRNISAGSLHKLLLHAMAAQWTWLNRFLGTPRAMPDEKEFPTLESLKNRWLEVHAMLREFVNKQTLDSLNQAVTYKTMRGDIVTCPLGQLLLHVTDHGTYHRGQQNTLIKMAGGEPVTLDIFYYRWRIAHRL